MIANRGAKLGTRIVDARAQRLVLEFCAVPVVHASLLPEPGAGRGAAGPEA